MFYVILEILYCIIILCAVETEIYGWKSRSKMSLVSQKHISCQNIYYFVHVQLHFHCSIFYCFLFFIIIIIFIILPVHFHVTITHHLLYLLFYRIPCARCASHNIGSHFTWFARITTIRQNTYNVITFTPMNTHSEIVITCPIAMQNDSQLHSCRIRN